jgi:uncharacterized protein YcbK (DUF882 family)
MKKEKVLRWFKLSLVVITSLIGMSSGCKCPDIVGLPPMPSQPVSTPGPAPNPTATPSPAAPYVEITTPLQNSSFVTTTPLTVNGLAKNVPFNSSSQVNYTIIGWVVAGETGTDYTLEETGEMTTAPPGLLYTYTLSPPAAPTGRGRKLYYEIIANLALAGTNYTSQVNIVQDYIDQCRQEYIDFNRAAATRPMHEDFTNSQGSTNFALTEFLDKHDLNNVSQYKKNAVYVQATLTAGLESMRTNLGRKININVAYRWPSTQYSVSSDAPEGNHQYGIAADLNVPNATKAEWDNMKTAAKAAGACVEPSDYGGRENDYTYIHVDWRGVCPTDW